MGNPLIDRLRDERDGFRNGQEQLQALCDGLQDTIKKYAAERKVLIAESDRLKKENTELKQTSGELCPVCGWRFYIPSMGCYKCKADFLKFNDLPF